MDLLKPPRVFSSFPFTYPFYHLSYTHRRRQNVPFMNGIPIFRGHNDENRLHNEYTKMLKKLWNIRVNSLFNRRFFFELRHQQSVQGRAKFLQFVSPFAFPHTVLSRTQQSLESFSVLFSFSSSLELISFFPLRIFHSSFYFVNRIT